MTAEQVIATLLGMITVLLSIIAWMGLNFLPKAIAVEQMVLDLREELKVVRNRLHRISDVLHPMAIHAAVDKKLVDQLANRGPD